MKFGEWLRRLCGQENINDTRAGLLRYARARVSFTIDGASDALGMFPLHILLLTNDLQRSGFLYSAPYRPGHSR